jgi:chorismate mutase
MIEVHTNPAYAKSDANQQLTPEEFYNLLQKLGFCNNDTKAFSNELDLLRKNIDLLDEELLDILYKRMQLVNRVGAYKNKKKMGVYQVDRWEKLLSSRIQKGNQIGLNSHFIRSLFESIHKESINKQNQTKPIDKHQLCGKLVNK